MSKWIGDRKFYHTLLSIAAPLVIQQLITSSMQLVDNMMVGSIGKEALSGVTVINQLYSIILFVTFGAVGGAGVLTAQYFGAKDHDKLRQTFRFKIIIALSIAIFSFLVFSFFGDSLAQIYSKNPVILAYANDYVSIIRWSMIPWAMTVAISTTFRDTKVTLPLMLISLFAIVVNSGFNYLFIFGAAGFPTWGVRGAAFATLLARLIEMMLMVMLLMGRGKIFHTKIRDLPKINRTVLSAIFAMAIPLTLNELLWSGGQSVFLALYATRGDVALASMSIANSVSNLLFIAFGGIGTATAVLVGNTLGENKLGLAKANSLKLIAFSVSFAVFSGLILFGLSFFILDIYNVDELTKSIARSVIRLNALFIPVFSYNVNMYFTLRSGGDTRSTLMMDSGYMWLISIPIATAIAFLTQVPVILMFFFVQFLDIPKMIFATMRYRKGHWVRNLALHQDNASGI
ncbi:MAG: MATE family efflux transporter [Candidatus Izemoplasmatales bacterium]